VEEACLLAERQVTARGTGTDRGSVSRCSAKPTNPQTVACPFCVSAVVSHLTATREKSRPHRPLVESGFVYCAILESRKRRKKGIYIPLHSFMSHLLTFPRYQTSTSLGFFFVYSLLACDLSDHGEIIYSPFPVRSPCGGGSLQAPLCPPPRPVPRRCEAYQGNYKERRASVTDRGKKRQEKGPSPYPVPADAMKSGVGRNSGRKTADPIVTVTGQARMAGGMRLPRSRSWGGTAPVISTDGRWTTLASTREVAVGPLQDCRRAVAIEEEGRAEEGERKRTEKSVRARGGVYTLGNLQVDGFGLQLTG